jgi:hypothetical protein
MVGVYAESSHFRRFAGKSPVRFPYQGGSQITEENPMMHKFQVGQSVALIARAIRQAAPGTYEITRLMPENETEPHYCIKSDAERHERVVPESELETSLTS